MQWNEGAIWSVTLPSCTAADLADYAYIVMENGLISRMEWKNQTFCAPSTARSGALSRSMDVRKSTTIVPYCFNDVVDGRLVPGGKNYWDAVISLSLGVEIAFSPSSRL